MKTLVFHDCSCREAFATHRGRIFAVAALVVCSLFLLPSVAAADNTGFTRGDVPRSEVLQLPQFCWARYVKELQSSEYRIPYTSCGPGTNHYCDGLLRLSRVKRGVISNSTQRTRELGLARSAALYTLDWIKEYPTCPIRPHIESTVKQIDAMLAGMPK